MSGLNKKQARRLLDSAKQGVDNRISILIPDEEVLTVMGTKIVELNKSFDSIETAIAYIILNQKGQTPYIINVDGDTIIFRRRK